MSSLFVLTAADNAPPEPQIFLLMTTCQRSDGDFGNQYIFYKQFSRRRMCWTEKKCTDPLIVHYKILWRQWIWYFRHSQEEQWYSSTPTILMWSDPGSMSTFLSLFLQLLILTAVQLSSLSIPSFILIWNLFQEEMDDWQTAERDVE